MEISLAASALSYAITRFFFTRRRILERKSRDRNCLLRQENKTIEKANIHFNKLAVYFENQSER